jgi:hypothetical protein
MPHFSELQSPHSPTGSSHGTFAYAVMRITSDDMDIEKERAQSPLLVKSFMKHFLCARHFAKDFINSNTSLTFTSSLM